MLRTRTNSILTTQYDPILTTTDLSCCFLVMYDYFQMISFLLCNI